ncbi:hypothetical protein [Stenotrophomonas lactitubi]|nr:hypothetical protein [Stenotrophomonas lactitubi]
MARIYVSTKVDTHQKQREVDTHQKQGEVGTHQQQQRETVKGGVGPVAGA